VNNLAELAIPIEFFLSRDYRGSEPLDRGTWLALLAHCYVEGNDGRIRGAGRWTDRTALQVAGVTMQEIRKDSGLWTWEGEDLVVSHYKPRQLTAPAIPAANPPRTIRTLQQEASEIVSLYHKAARVGRIVAQCEFAIHRSVTEGKGTLEEIRVKTEAICIILDALQERRWIPAPFTFFDQEQWRNPPQSFLPRQAPVQQAPARQPWQVKKDLEVITEQINDLCTSEDSYTYKRVVTDEETGSRELRKLMKDEPKQRLAALREKKKQLQLEIQ
jgi:hypothetical protein